MTVETYVTQEGDSVDLIAYRRFGKHGMEAAILDANPGLAAHGPILPIGIKISIPIPAKDSVKLKFSRQLYGESSL